MRGFFAALRMTRLKELLIRRVDHFCVRSLAVLGSVQGKGRGEGVRFALGADAHLSRKVRGEDGAPDPVAVGQEMREGCSAGGTGFFLRLRTEARRVRARSLAWSILFQKPTK